MGKMVNCCSEHTLVECNHFLQEFPRIPMEIFVLNLLIMDWQEI